MKKSKMTMLGVMSVSALLVLAGCKGDPSTTTSSESAEATSEAHVHTADTEWHHDENNHWHLCTGCGEKMDVAAHSFEETVVAPTDDAQVIPYIHALVVIPLKTIIPTSNMQLALMAEIMAM